MAHGAVCGWRRCARLADRALAYARPYMTWVFGSPTWLGTSVCLADIQVTVGDTTFDCLRKVYGLDQNVMAGFAGNVRTGFAMLARLKRLARIMRERAAAPVVGAAELSE
jgi:hypothetical protein